MYLQEYLQMVYSYLYRDTEVLMSSIKNTIKHASPDPHAGDSTEKSKTVRVIAFPVTSCLLFRNAPRFFRIFVYAFPKPISRHARFALPASFIDAPFSVQTDENSTREEFNQQREHLLREVLAKTQKVMEEQRMLQEKVRRRVTVLYRKQRENALFSSGEVNLKYLWYLDVCVCACVLLLAKRTLPDLYILNVPPCPACVDARMACQLYWCEYTRTSIAISESILETGRKIEISWT